MFGLMMRIRRDELRCGNRRRRAFRHFVGIMDILDYARPRQHETGLDGPDLIEDIMGKPRKEQPEAESIFANNPFIEGLFAKMLSASGCSLRGLPMMSSIRSGPSRPVSCWRGRA